MVGYRGEIHCGNREEINSRRYGGNLWWDIVRKYIVKIGRKSTVGRRDEVYVGI